MEEPTTPTTTPTPEAEAAPTAPAPTETGRAQERIQRQSAEINALKAERDALQAIAARVTEAETAAAAAQKKAETWITLARHGVTDEDAADLVLHRYRRLGEEAPALAEYLTGEARSDRLLSGVWTVPPVSTPTTEAAPETAAPTTTTAPPAPNAQTAPATRAPASGLTRARIDAMSAAEQAERIGEIREWYRRQR